MNAEPRTLDDHPKTFKVNEFITLKLERNQTHIYVKGKLFRQCKYVLLSIPVDEVSSFDAINSVDEAAELLDHSEEPVYKNITKRIEPETEFWVHSSNLQAWVENDYDTRLIHRNLAFPLLKELVKMGDPKARRSFKEEIVKRLKNNHPSVVKFLKEEGYLDYLSHEEQLFALLEDDEAQALLTIELKYRIEFEVVEEEDLGYYSPKSRWYVGISNKNITFLNLNNIDINAIIDNIIKFSNLQVIRFRDKSLIELPNKMRELDLIREIGMIAPKIERIQDWILELKDLELLVINEKSLLKEAVENIKKLEEKGIKIIFR